MPSNKGPKIGVTLIADGMGKGYKVLIPKIDKVSFTYDIPDDHHKAVISFLYHWVEDHRHLKSVPPYKTRYRRTFIFTFPENGATVRIDADPKSSKTPMPFFRFEFNPAALGKSGIECFQHELHGVLMNEHPWEKIAKTCRVTRLDIAVDLLGVRMEDLIIVPGITKQQLKKFAIFSASGKLETIYPIYKHGAKAPLRIYDKAQQLSDTGAPAKFEGVAYARVEAELDGKKLQGKPLMSLHKLKNPFLGLGVIDPTNPVSPPESLHAWSYFLDSCRMRGKEGALEMLPTDELRSVYAQTLEKADRRLWNPEKLWKHWPKVLESSGLLP